MSFLQERSFSRRPGLQSVTTVSVTSVTGTTATANGQINTAGADLNNVTTNFSFGTPQTQQGFVYSTSPNPTLLTGTIVVDGGIGGAFSDSLMGLTVGTTYYVDAYATNAAGTSYGGDVSFTTSGGGGATSDPLELQLLGVG